MTNILFNFLVEFKPNFSILILSEGEYDKEITSSTIEFTYPSLFYFSFFVFGFILKEKLSE